MRSPVGMRRRSMGCKIMSVSRLALKSRPALSGVAYCGKGWCEWFTISIFIMIGNEPLESVRCFYALLSELQNVNRRTIDAVRHLWPGLALPCKMLEHRPQTPRYTISGAKLLKLRHIPDSFCRKSYYPAWFLLFLRILPLHNAFESLYRLLRKLVQNFLHAV